MSPPLTPVAERMSFADVPAKEQRVKVENERNKEINVSRLFFTMSPGMLG